MVKARWVGGCGKKVKYSLYTINIVIMISGGAVLGLGIWTDTDHSAFNVIADENLYSQAPYSFVVCGLATVGLAILGCVASIREVRCLLCIFAIILFVTFMVLLFAGIFCLVFRVRIQKTAELHLINSLHAYDTDEEVRRSWDAAHATLECCGVTSPENWRPFVDTLPRSCCPAATSISNCTADLAYHQGCLDLLKRVLREHALLLGTAGVCLSLTLLTGVVLSTILCMLVKKRESLEME